MHQRGPDGALAPIEFEIPQEPEFLMGGGGLYGTAGDYLKFTRMIMRGGRLNGTPVLRPETVDLMSQNHIGPLEVGVIKTAIPALSNDVELFPGMSKKWGLSFLINTQGPTAWRGPALPTRISGSIGRSRCAACSSRRCCRSTTRRPSICS